MKPGRRWILAAACVLMALSVSGCAAPRIANSAANGIVRTTGKAAGGVIRGTGKAATGVVKGTGKAVGAVTSPVRR